MIFTVHLQCFPLKWNYLNINIGFVLSPLVFNRYTDLTCSKSGRDRITHSSIVDNCNDSDSVLLAKFQSFNWSLDICCSDWLQVRPITVVRDQVVALIFFYWSVTMNPAKLNMGWGWWWQLQIWDRCNPYSISKIFGGKKCLQWQHWLYLHTNVIKSSLMLIKYSKKCMHLG